MTIEVSKYGYPFILPDEEDQAAVVLPQRTRKRNSTTSLHVTFAKNCKVITPEGEVYEPPLEAASLKQDEQLLLNDETGQLLILEPDIEAIEECEKELLKQARIFLQKFDDPIVKTLPRQKVCQWEDITVLLERETDGSPNAVEAYLKNSTNEIKQQDFVAAMNRLDSLCSRYDKDKYRTQTQVAALRRYHSLLIDTYNEKGLTPDRMVHATASVHRALFKIQFPYHRNNEEETGINNIRGVKAAKKVTCNNTQWFVGLMKVIFGVVAVSLGIAFIVPTKGVSSVGVAVGLLGMFKGRSDMRVSAGDEKMVATANRIF